MWLLSSLAPFNTFSFMPNFFKSATLTHCFRNQKIIIIVSKIKVRIIDNEKLNINKLRQATFNQLFQWNSLTNGESVPSWLIRNEVFHRLLLQSTKKNCLLSLDKAREAQANSIDFFQKGKDSEGKVVERFEKDTTTNKKMESTANPAPADSDNANWKDAKSVYDFKVKTINGEEVSLEKYRGHVLLVVNVASECGFADRHYKELIELDEKYRDIKGLRILAFPCNQFGGQEPGNNEEIVCSLGKRNVKFDVFEKINVNGNDAHPLFKYLKLKQGGLLIDAIKWNFTKFIVDKEGQPVERFAANKNPLDLESTLEKYW